MTTPPHPPRALITVFEPEQALDFARFLIERGWEIIASAETVKLLEDNGLPVVPIETFIGQRFDLPFPPTLFPTIEAALTTESPQAIDLVLAMPYPISVGNDVGGRTLLALAAKGGRIPVMDAVGMARAREEIEANGAVGATLRRELAARANAAIAVHFANLAAGQMVPPGERGASGEAGRHDGLWGEWSAALINGENPYQLPADLYVSDGDGDGDDPLALPAFARLSGEAPCFTNMADADCLLHTLCLLAEAFEKNAGKVPFLVVAAKHGNACGAALDWSDPARAIDAALLGNPRAVWGGELIVNFPLDGPLAERLLRSSRREALLGAAGWMLDVVMAPAFDADAIAILGQRERRKLLANPALTAPRLARNPVDIRPVRGGFLRQPPPDYILDFDEATHLDGPPDATRRDALILAWAVAFSSNHGGNEVALAKAGRLLGCGGGPATVDAVETAISRARGCGHDLAGSVFAADAFFPYEDAPGLLADAGVSAGLVPAGGQRFEQVRDRFAAAGVALTLLPEERRGFCRH